MIQDPNEANNFETEADKFLNEEVKETPAESSAAIKPEDETKTPETATAEVDKTEQVKEVEADSSLSVEEKLGKIKEILGDDEKAIDAYVKQKGYHTDPAWQKQRELIDKLKQEKEGKASGLSEEDKAALDEFKKYRSSAEYIQTSMKTQGYTQEAIDKKLKESGIDVASNPQDDVQLVVSKLGLKLDGLPENEKRGILANIEDVIRVADVLISDRLGKVLPKELGPIQEHVSSITKSENASKSLNQMKETVKADGVLDFEKDIEPELNKFMDENPDATQQDVSEHFKVINHRLSVERLKIGKKKEDRDDKKSQIRQNTPFSRSNPNAKKTGNFENDADAFLETMNVN